MIATKYLTVFLVLLPQSFISTEGTLGVDVSQSVSVRSFQCLKLAGNDFVIVRAFRSNGIPDTNAPQTIRSAHEAGITRVDAYMFPCPKCGNAKKQVQDMLNLNLDVRMIWLDIEIFNWFSNKSDNRGFFEGLISALENRRILIGVYTSLNNWSTIMGSDYIKGSRFPLWYARYDGKTSFGDFKQFGGWQNPTIKQFAPNRHSCGTVFDVNWRP